MAIDPSISLAYRPPVIQPLQIQSPLEQFAKVLSLRNLMTQDQEGQLGLQTRRLQLAQAQRQAEEQQDYVAAMKAYAQNAGTATAPAGAAPIQTPTLPTPAVQTAPIPMSPGYGLIGGRESVGGLPNIGALPSPPPPAPSTPLSALMTPAPQTQQPIVAPQSPSPATAGNPRLLGMTAPAFIARFPLSGMAKVKEAFALDEAEAKAAKEQHDAAVGVADELGRAGIAVRDSKDPATQFVTELTALGNKGRLPWPAVRQMISDGYEAHKNDIQGFIDKAQSVKDTTEIRAKNLAAGLDERKQAAMDIGPVTNQDGYDKFLAIHPTLRPILGDTFSPDVKDAAQHLTTEGKDLPKARMDAAVAASGILEPARARGQDAYDTALAQFPKYIQDLYRDAPTALEVRNRALTAEQKTTAASAAAGQTQQQATATANIEGKLRDDFTQATKTFPTIREAYGRIQAAKSAPPSGASDIALLYGYMKVLDPGSTVREGEFATASNAGGIPDKIVAMYNQILRGDRLSPKVRTEMLDNVDLLYSRANEDYQKTSQQFTDIAKRTKVDPRNVIIDYTTTAPTPATKEKTKPQYETIEKTGAGPGGRTTGAITIAPPGKVKVTSPEGVDYWADTDKLPELKKRNFTW